MAGQKKILIIEDESSLREALEFKFKGQGFNVFTAVNGEEALKLALEEHPDIMLLDIIMPVMDGMTTLKELRKDEWGKTAPVMLLTNLSSNNEIEEAIEGGVYDYLIKTDWTLDEVIEKVNQRLAK